MNIIDKLIEAIGPPAKPTYPRRCPNGGWDHVVIDGGLSAADCPECEDVLAEVEFEYLSDQRFWN